MTNDDKSHPLEPELEKGVNIPSTTVSDKPSLEHEPTGPPAAVITFPDGGMEAWIVRNTYRNSCAEGLLHLYFDNR
jgi:hypothetical protein